MSGGTLRTERIETLSALSALETQWWRLWAVSPGSTPFQSPAWLVPWWRHFQPGPLVAAGVFSGEHLVGLGLFFYEDGAYGRRLLPVGIGISDHLDILLDPSVPGVGEALLAFFSQQPDWEVLELEDLAPGAAAFGLSCPSGWTETGEPQIACPGLSMSGAVNEEGLPTEIPRKRRQQFRRNLKLADARGGSTIETADAASFLDQLVVLHDARWQSKNEDGVMADRRVIAFQGEAMQALEPAGLARFFVIRIGGELAAAYYGFRWRDRAGFYLSGFDPRFAQESPLGILIGHALRDAVGSGATDFSFLRGQEHYKYLWGAADRWNMRRSFRRLVR